MKKTKKEEIVRSVDAVHLMGFGASYYGTFASEYTAILSVGSLKKKQKVGSTVRKNNIDDTTQKSWICFTNTKAIDQMVRHLNKLKKAMKRKKK